jgi:putative flippase GtrA
MLMNLPRFIKFIAIGIVNTIFGYALYAFLLFIGSSYIKALLFSTIAGVVFNFFSYENIVFSGYKGRIIFCKFFISYILIYLLNALLLSILMRYYFVSPLAGQVICIPLCVFLSWLLMNYWVFKRN